MTTTVAKAELLDAVQRLGGTRIEDGGVGVLITEGKHVVLAGTIAPGARIDPWALSSRAPLSADGVAFVGVGAGGHERAQQWADALSQAQTGLAVTRAVGVNGGLWSDIHNASEGGIVPPERQDIIDLNPSGVADQGSIYKRLIPLDEGMRVDAPMQRKMSTFINEAMQGTSALERTEYVRQLASSLAHSVDPHRDRATVATVTELMRDPSVEAGVTSHAVLDKELSDGLLRSARMAVVDRVASPVWVAASAGVWAHGRDEVGPVPTEVLAVAVRPHVEHSRAAEALYANLASGHSPDRIVAASEDAVHATTPSPSVNVQAPVLPIAPPASNGMSWGM